MNLTFRFYCVCFVLWFFALTVNAEPTNSIHARTFQQALQSTNTLQTATPFGDYDRSVIQAIQQNWYTLLAAQTNKVERTGKAVIGFDLHADGSVNNIKCLESTVGDQHAKLGQQAIQKAAPFQPWPADLQRMVGANTRATTMTFYYY